MASIFERVPPVIANPVDHLGPEESMRAAALVIAARCRKDIEDVDDVLAMAVYICDGPVAAAEFYADRQSSDVALSVAERAADAQAQPPLLQIPDLRPRQADFGMASPHR